METTLILSCLSECEFSSVHCKSDTMLYAYLVYNMNYTAKHKGNGLMWTLSLKTKDVKTIQICTNREQHKFKTAIEKTTFGLGYHFYDFLTLYDITSFGRIQ